MILYYSKPSENNVTLQVSTVASPTIASSPTSVSSIYSFDEVGLSFSAPADMSVSGEKIDETTFILTVERNRYPEEDYYQLYGNYRLSNEDIDQELLKEGLEEDSIKEISVGGFPAISGQNTGERNRYITQVITDRGLFTFATSQPTEENAAITAQILSTMSLQ